VSRGLIRSEEGSGKSRARRYLVQDIERLQQQKAQRRNPALAAKSALHFGDPVLESAVSHIDQGWLTYRGQNAISLATTQSFEEVTLCLWGDNFASDDVFASTTLLPAQISTFRELEEGIAAYTPVERIQVLLSLLASHDLSAYSFTPQGVAQCGVRILQLMILAVTDRVDNQPMASQLQRSWLPDRPDACSLLDAALILCADHELNVSTFTARCVTSAGATPYAAVLAGLAALQGVRHGGHTERVEVLLREAKNAPRQAVASRLRQGESIPGFGHPLYPNGDPRGKLLLDLAGSIENVAYDVAAADAIAHEVWCSIGLLPNLDFGLTTLALALGLPAGSALTLFAIGRTSGWIAHIIEQIEVGRLIRPRATYVGRPLEVDQTAGDMDAQP
jgi:citrate synthase